MDTSSCNTYEQNHASLVHQNGVDGDDQEESGWATIIEEFSYTTHHEYSDHQDKSSCSLLGVSSSLVSGAAKDSFSCKSSPVKIKFGKARTKKIVEDDSLEDTATSPANSPKVRLLLINLITQENMRSMMDHQIKTQEGDEQKVTMMMNLQEVNNNNNNMDLRSRGLCVVPISMLAKFNDQF
ncbi:unnamed protein product [Cochlearia groenlandica]